MAISIHNNNNKIVVLLDARAASAMLTAHWPKSHTYRKCRKSCLQDFAVLESERETTFISLRMSGAGKSSVIFCIPI